MKIFINLKPLLGLLLILNLQSTIVNLQSSNLYAQDPELFEHTWYLEKVVIENESYYTIDYTDNSATVVFFETDEKIEVFLCEFDNFESGTDFSPNNSFTIFDVDLNPFFGDCAFFEGGDLLFFFNIYFSIYLDENYEFPKNPFTYSIEAIDDYHQLTITNGEGDWAVYNSVLLSTIDFSYSDFTLYPNPVKETLNINNHSNQQVSAIIYDLNGKQMKSYTIENNTTVLEVKSLNQGLYFIVFETETGERVSKKFVKK